MVVSTRTPDVVAARAGVFEFLLVNHPLDCPGVRQGRRVPAAGFLVSGSDPIRAGWNFRAACSTATACKADVDFGPTLMLNRNRCILCTRCVRFMRDIDGDAQINIIDRGYGSEIATFQEEGVHSLLSGNLMDVCPVGAITTRDYRFKSRPWDNPNAADTICTQCAKGCNTTAWIKAKPEWAKGSRLIRFTPRFNPDVNGYWMCDIGRFDYHWIEGDDRLQQAAAAQRRSGALSSRLTWHDALSKLADRARRRGRARIADGVRFLLSAHASHEELFLFRRLAEARWSARRRSRAISWRVSREAAAAGHEVQGAAGRRAERQRRARCSDSCRRRSARKARRTSRRCVRPSNSGRVAALYVFDPGPDGSIGDVSWIVDARASGTLPLLVVQGVLLTELARAADFVLPGASCVEKEASYTNEQGRLQGASRAISAAGRRDGRLADSREPRRLALGVPFDYTSGAARPRRHRRALAGVDGARRADDAGVRPADRRRGTGCRRRTRRSDGSGTSCSRICRR